MLPELYWLQKMSQIFQTVGGGGWGRPPAVGNHYLFILSVLLLVFSFQWSLWSLLLLERVLMSLLAGRRRPSVYSRNFWNWCQDERREEKPGKIFRKDKNAVFPLTLRNKQRLMFLQTAYKFPWDLPLKKRKHQIYGLLNMIKLQLRCKVDLEDSFRGWWLRCSFLGAVSLIPGLDNSHLLKPQVYSLSRHVSLGIPQKSSESHLSCHPRKSKSSYCLPIMEA